MPLNSCRLIDLPKIEDRRGNLSFIEGSHHIPFEIKRVYYVYDVPGGADRGGHAHKNLQQFMVAVSGSFEVKLDDGRSQRSFQLNRPYFGVFIPAMHWRDLSKFSSGSVCLVLASAPYIEEEYIRDYRQFLDAAGKQC